MQTTIFFLLVMAALLHLTNGQAKCLPQAASYDLQPHPDDCSKYLVMCLGGGPEEKDCPEGTVFNSVKKNCVLRLSEQDTCTPANPVQECGLGKVDFIPSPLSCQLYSNCSDKSLREPRSPFRPFENECPYPDGFDVNHQRCVNYATVACGIGRLLPKWPCDYLASKLQYASPMACYIKNPSCRGKVDGPWPYPQRLWSPYFITCRSERLVNEEERCEAEGLISMAQFFHPEERKCLPLWNIPRAHGGLEPDCTFKDPGLYMLPEISILVFYCPGKKKYLCLPNKDENRQCSELLSISNEDPFCSGKEDGLWPIPQKMWSPFYLECLSQKVKNGEEQCKAHDVGLTQLFHPEERKCAPLWEIPREHGGFKSSCESKDPGYYSYDIFAYRCPEEEKFLCRPPLFYHSSDDDIGRCDRIVEPQDCNETLTKTKQENESLKEQLLWLNETVQNSLTNCNNQSAMSQASRHHYRHSLELSLLVLLFYREGIPQWFLK